MVTQRGGSRYADITQWDCQTLFRAIRAARIVRHLMAVLAVATIGVLVIAHHLYLDRSLDDRAVADHVAVLAWRVVAAVENHDARTKP